MAASNKDLLRDPVGRTLAFMMGSVSLSMVSTFLFQVVDTYFVGQLGAESLTALSFSATAYFFGVALFMGMAVGVSALVASALGAGDRRSAQRIATVALVVAAVVAIVICGVGVVTIDRLFTLLGADASLLPLIAEYMVPIYAGMPLLILSLLGNAAIQATGDVKLPSIIFGVAGIINVTFDYLLIFGSGPIPRLEIAGAAYATVFSWLFAFISVSILLFRRGLVTWPPRPFIAVMREIGRLSSPAIATQILLPLTAAFTTFLAAIVDPNLVAAFGVTQRIEALALVGISSLSVVIVPFVAQNLGAGLRDRVEKAIVFAGRMSVYWGLGLIVLFGLFATPIARVFSSEEGIVEYTRLYFYVVVVSYIPYAMLVLTAAIFNGVQRPGVSLRVLFMKTVLFTLPALFIGSCWGGPGIFVAIAVSNLFGYLYAARHMRRALQAWGSELAEERPIDAYIRDGRTIVRSIRHLGGLS